MFITPDFRLSPDTSGDNKKRNRFISLMYRKETVKKGGVPTVEVTDGIDQYKAIMYKEDKKSSSVVAMAENGEIYMGRLKGKPPVMVLATLPDDSILILDENGVISKV